jgi:hypothetical protein
MYLHRIMLKPKLFVFIISFSAILFLNSCTISRTQPTRYGNVVLKYRDDTLRTVVFKYKAPRTSTTYSITYEYESQMIYVRFKYRTGKKFWASDGFLCYGNRVLERYINEPHTKSYIYFYNDMDTPAACLKTTMAPHLEINPEGECDDDLVRILNEELTRQKRTLGGYRRIPLFRYISLNLILKQYPKNEEVRMMINQYLDANN